TGTPEIAISSVPGRGVIFDQSGASSGQRTVRDRAVEEILATYPAWAQPRSTVDSLGAGGGLSGARLWRFDSLRGPMVLRAWPPDGPGRDHLKGVHAWLFKLAELAFVPVPIRGEAGGSLLETENCCWEVTPWMPGAADNSQPPERAHLDAAFEGLAAVHRN